MDLCEGCGAEVVLGLEVDEGWPAVFERLMVRVAGELLLREHLCRDYLAWHRPADRRDVNTLDVPHGWRPRHRPLRVLTRVA